MRNLYLLALCLFLLTSCSPRLVTKGITDKTSNYIVTTEGKQINASSLNIQGKTVTTDTTSYPLTSLSAVKIGQAYLGVKNGDLYDGVYYGKLMLLRRNMGIIYDMQKHTSRPNYYYYLQKQGQSNIVDFTNKSLIKSVSDDPLALRKAKAARIYTNVNLVTAFTAIAGLSCVFLPYTSPVRKPAVIAGLVSMPTFLITLPIASHKRYKTIVVYNR